MSFISSFDIISVVVPDLKIFYIFFIFLHLHHAAAVNPKGAKTLLANGLVTFWMDQEVSLEIFLIASSEIFEFLIA